MWWSMGVNPEGPGDYDGCYGRRYIRRRRITEAKRDKASQRFLAPNALVASHRELAGGVLGGR